MLTVTIIYLNSSSTQYSKVLEYWSEGKKHHIRHYENLSTISKVTTIEDKRINGVIVRPN
jgi:hypothetical protein